MSWSEILIVAIVALIVVGPKDLPGMFRQMGKFTAKARRMAREFTSAMEAAADDAELADVTKTLKAATDPKQMGLDAVKKAVDLDDTKGPATKALSKERAEAAAKIHKKTAENAAAKRAADAETSAKAAEPAAEAAPGAPKAAPKKTPKKAPKKTPEKAAKTSKKAAAKGSDA